MSTDAISALLKKTQLAHLRVLIHLRFLFIAIGIGLPLGHAYFLNGPLPWTRIGMVWGLQCLSAIGAWQRLSHSRNVGQWDLYIQLLTDILTMGFLLFSVGRSASPFAMVLLIQVVMAAYLLRSVARYSLIGIVMIIQGTLILWPLISTPHVLALYTDITHIQVFYGLANTIAFGLTVLATLYFVSRIVAHNTAEQHALHRLHVDLQTEKHISNLGLLAIGSAHEMATPLNTLLLTLSAWDQDGLSQQQVMDVALMTRQVTRCQKALEEWLGAARVDRMAALSLVSADIFFKESLSEWAQSHDSMAYQVQTYHGLSSQQMGGDPLLKKALVNVYDNAHLAGATEIRMGVIENASTLKILIENNGATIPKPQLQALQENTQAGLGLRFTRIIVSQYEGTVTIDNLKKGVRIVIEIPRQKILL